MCPPKLSAAEPGLQLCRQWTFKHSHAPGASRSLLSSPALQTQRQRELSLRAAAVRVRPAGGGGGWRTIVAALRSL